MDFPCEVEAQIRYNSSATSAEIMYNNNRYEIKFNEPQLAVTPGQSIVFYRDNVVMGGGIIENTMRILGENQTLDIDWKSWERPAIFTLIQELGNVPESDFRQSMNLGIGMILIIKPDGFSHLQAHFATQGEAYIQLGTVS